MKIQREWATPLAAGTFLLSAATGVLIFFHVDSGLNKAAHEWLSWILLAGVGLHLAANFRAFGRHLADWRGRLLIGSFAVLLLASFAGGGERREPPFAAPVRALSGAPLDTLAAVAGVDADQLQQRLAGAGLQPDGRARTLAELTGPDLRRQIEVLGTILAAGPATARAAP